MDLPRNGHSRSKFDFLFHKAGYQVAALFYLLVADFWLAKVMLGSNGLAVVAFFIFCWLFVVSRKSFVLFDLNRPLVAILVCIGCLFLVNAAMDRGNTGDIVLVRYFLLLSYFLVGQLVCLGFGFRVFIMVLAFPFMIRAGTGLTLLMASAGDLGSLSRLMLKTEGDALLNSRAYFFGVGSYTFYGAVALLIPFCISLIPGMSKRWAFFWTAGVCVLFLNVLLAGYLSPVVQLALGLGILAWYRFKTKTIFVVALFLPVLGVAIKNFPTFASVLDKMLRVLSTIQSSGLLADPTGRGYLATLSIETFKKNWLIGVGPQEFGPEYMGVIGGHSTILDWPAQYGILGLLFIMLVFREVWNAGGTFQRSGRKYLSWCTKSFLGMIVLAVIINPLFLKESLDLVVFSLLGALFQENHCSRKNKSVAQPGTRIVGNGNK